MDKTLTLFLVLKCALDCIKIRYPVTYMTVCMGSTSIVMYLIYPLYNTHILMHVCTDRMRDINSHYWNYFYITYSAMPTHILYIWQQIKKSFTLQADLLDTKCYDEEFDSTFESNIHKIYSANSVFATGWHYMPDFSGKKKSELSNKN